MTDGLAQTRDVQETTVWRLAAPLKLHFDQFGLYAHGHGGSYAHDRECFRLEAGGRLRFDRLLNIFPYAKWMALTGVADLVVRVVYRGGPCTVSVVGFDGQTTRLVWSSAWLLKLCTRLNPLSSWVWRAAENCSGSEVIDGPYRSFLAHCNKS